MLGRPIPVRWLVVTMLALGLSACGSGHDDHGAAIPATASDAAECGGPPYRHGQGDYESGLEKVTGDARKALDSYLDEEGSGLPEVTYAEAARHDGTALFTWTAGGRVLAAFVVRDGQHDVEGHHGWGVTSYAVCDPAEWPTEKTDQLGLQIWSDQDGIPVPTSLVVSQTGPQNCGYEDMTYLRVDKDREFYGTPPDDLQRFLATTYDPHTTVPPDATDTGFQREGRELWLTADAAYVASPDGDAERWPAPNQRFGCD